MSAGFLLDEQLPTWWRGAICRRQPQLDIRHIGDADAPPRATADPLILEWCEANDFILLTNNRGTMPRHLADHVAAGRHVPGVFLVDPTRHIIRLADDLALIAGATFPGEYQDQILFMPTFG